MPTPKAPKKKRAYHHGDLRAALIEASAELVHAHGAAAFSLREAARQVGVDPAACYRHFRDRQQVLVALAQRGFAQLAAAFDETKRQHPHRGPRATLHAMGTIYLRSALLRPAEFKVMFGESGWSARDPRMRLPEVTTTPYEFLEREAAGCLAERPGDVKSTELANALWAMAHGVSRLLIDGAIPLSPEDAQAMLDRSLDALIDGPSATKPSKKR